MSQTKIFVSKISIPGKATDELSYVFSDRTGGNDPKTPVLFGLFHLFGTSEIYHSIIKETVKHFLDFFHRSQGSFSSDITDSQFDSSEFIFENAIQYTNERVTQFILEQQEVNLRASTFDVKRIHFILGALFGDSLYLSITGSQISPIYIYPVFRKEGFSHYAVLDIADSANDGTESQRIFSNIVSGKLSIQGSTFVMVNQHFLDYISLDQLKQAVTNMSVQNLAPYFEGLLGKVHGKNDFSALFINPHYTGPIPQEPQSSSATSRSMAGLNSTAQGTTTILSPSVLSPLKPVVQSALKVSAQTTRTLSSLVGSGAQKAWSLVLTSVKEGKLNPGTLKEAAFRAGTALTSHAADTLTLGKHLLDPQTREHAIAQMTRTLRQVPERIGSQGRKWLGGLSRTSKALLVLGVIFTLLFVQSIVTIKRGQVAAQKSAQLQELARTIELKIDLAEASLLYDNGSKAQAILLEAEGLLADFPTESEQQTRFDQLLSRIQGIKAKMAHAVLISEPLVVASLENQIPNPSALRMIGSKSSLLVYTSEAVYAVDTAKGAATLIDTQAKLPSIQCAASLDSRYAYFCIGDSNRLGRLDAQEKTVKTISIGFHENEKTISAVSVYNNRLYVLDRSSNMLYRHQKKGEDFGAGSPWLKENAVSLANAGDIALDGSVYILTSPTAIQRFASGQQESFSLPAIEPPLSNVTRMWTSDESPYLFLLERANKRVLVIDKKSQRLKNQFLSDRFADAHDLHVSAKHIFVLAGSAIYRIPLE